MAELPYSSYSLAELVEEARRLAQVAQAERQEGGGLVSVQPHCPVILSSLKRPRLQTELSWSRGRESWAAPTTLPKR